MADLSDYTNVNNFISWMQTSNWKIYNIPMLFSDELNSTYRDILNCEIVKKPYEDWRTPDGFFLKKRWWLTRHLLWWWDRVIDYSTFDNAEYAIVKDWDNIKVKKWNGTDTITLCTQPYNDSVYHSFKKWFSAPHWEVLASWTVSSVSTTSWIYRVTVTNAWWTVDAFKWKFLSITWWPSLWWIYKISSNTADTLTLQYGWDAAPDNTSTFKIYSDYWEILSFIWNDWIYSIINDIDWWTDNTYHFSSFGTVIDADWNDWRIFAVITFS